MTDTRTQFLLQVLDKIGGPLTAAVTAVPAAQSAAQSESADAQRVAELLNRAVQLGLSVAQQMNIRNEDQADGVHLSLTAFAGPLMAGQYRTLGRVPTEGEVKRLSAALQAVLSFADSFTPGIDSTKRIETANAATRPPDDDAQLCVQILNAFAPVLQAVGEYSFGRPEGRLAQEIAARLMGEAEDLRNLLFPAPLAEGERRRADLVLMTLLCQLYAAAHGAETHRLMALSDSARDRAVISTDPVWAAFDRQCAMVRVVAEQIIPAGKQGSETTNDSRKPETRRAAARKKSPANTPQTTPEATPSANPATNPPGTNPMAFFARKTEDAE